MGVVQEISLRFIKTIGLSRRPSGLVRRRLLPSLRNGFNVPFAPFFEC